MASSGEAGIRRCTICNARYVTERYCPLDGGAVVEAGPDPLIGRTLDGRYLVRALIGRGGMGSIYLADHIGLDKVVAIKFLAHRHDADSMARFRREARSASRVAHENVVQIFDVGELDDAAYFVMEHVAGSDLRTLLESGPLAPLRAVRIARQILHGLDAIHRAGIVHRDIKPSNVLLTTRGDNPDFVKLADFGVAKPTLDREALTSTGQIVGTPPFMAPEQFSDGTVDHRADIYAAGVTLFTMIHGGPPFLASSTSQLALMHMTQPAPQLDEPGVPPALAHAVARALAKSPDARFADARTFASTLDEIDAHMLASAGVTRAPGRDAPTVRLTPDRDASEDSNASKRRTRRALALGGFALGVCALSIAGVRAWQASSGAARSHADASGATAQRAFDANAALEPPALNPMPIG